MRICLRGVVWVALLGWILPAIWVSAQGEARATLSPLKIDAFPRIEAYLDIRDDQGKFLRGLPAQSVQLLEDNQLIQSLEISEIRPGLQVVTVLNPGPAFALRTSQGVLRYEAMMSELKNWGQSRLGSTLDDWSLLVTKGSGVSHVSRPEEWLDALAASKIDVRNVTPNLDTLSRALEVAADAPPRAGMSRVVLFFTQALDGNIAASIQDLVDRAVQQDIRIFVWMVAPPGAATSPSLQDLTRLATQTGGQFFVYTGENRIDPEILLSPLRSVYRLVYQSQANETGEHQVIAQVVIGQFSIASRPQTFQLQVQPPNPAFVSPPLEIQRNFAQPSADPTIPMPAQLTPGEQKLQIIIDFPDGRMRPLERTILWVDGQAVVQNTQAPFDTFLWDLTAYTSSADHTIKVEAIDTWGLSGSSIETTVRVQVANANRNLLAGLSGRGPLLVGLAVLVAGAVLVLVLLMAGRIRPGNLGALPRPQRSDPVTQPVPIRNDPGNRQHSGWTSRLQRTPRHDSPKTYALLIRLSESDNPVTAPPIPITSNEVTLGSDPNQAMILLNDPSIEPLHARILRDSTGIFRLCDEGSVAGAWINYTPVSREGSRLEHGDLIHIGRTGFRFTLRQSDLARKPVVTLEKDPEL